MAYKQRELIAHSSRGWKSETKVPARSGSGELQNANLFESSRGEKQTGQALCDSEGSNPIYGGCTLRTLNPDCLPILWCRQIGGGGREGWKGFNLRTLRVTHAVFNNYFLVFRHTFRQTYLSKNARIHLWLIISLFLVHMQWILLHVTTDHFKRPSSTPWHGSSLFHSIRHRTVGFSLPPEVSNTPVLILVAQMTKFQILSVPNEAILSQYYCSKMPVGCPQDPLRGRCFTKRCLHFL